MTTEPRPRSKEEEKQIQENFLRLWKAHVEGNLDEEWDKMFPEESNQGEGPKAEPPDPSKK